VWSLQPFGWEHTDWWVNSPFFPCGNRPELVGSIQLFEIQLVPLKRRKEIRSALDMSFMSEGLLAVDNCITSSLRVSDRRRNHVTS
jgi:hypothetical protein